MKTKKSCTKLSIALTVFCLLTSIHLEAQDTTFSANHLKAAEDMLTTMHVPSLVALSNNSMLNNMLEMQKPYNAQPELSKKFTKAIKVYFEKYGRWERVKNDIAKAYAAEFTEAEMKELTKFYLTPLGQKMIKKQSMLTQKGMDIGRHPVDAHQDELMKEMIKLEAEKN